MAEGKSLDNVKKSIAEHASEYLVNATVIVRLISFKYSVLGEVNNPGIYRNYNNQLTILEAISQAGDISPFGNRHRVLVLRPSMQGTSTFRLDITDNNILTSEGFFLLPNDIVYVEPIKSYNFRNNIPIITLTFASLSTLILLISFINANN
jgi:polysaccharide export outer membrane protein